MDETLLGFDVRERWVTPDPLWDTNRRARYLLRPDIVKLLSADTLVWTHTPAHAPFFEYGLYAVADVSGS